MTAVAPLRLGESESPFAPTLDRARPVRTDPRLKAYQRNPIAWMVDRMGIPERTLRWSLNPGYKAHRWDGTVDPLIEVAEGLGRWQNVGVESATGTGKTFLGALIALWFLDCFEGATVVTAAPKEKQLTLHIWKEIGRLWPTFQALRPHAELSKLRIQMHPGSDAWAGHGFIAGVGAEELVATKAAGFHAEHMLIITEETPGIHGAIMAAFENTCTAPHNLRLAFGNPDNQFDQLHRFCESPGVHAVRISAYDHPNVVTGDASVVPGAVSKVSIENRRLKYGADSPLFISRVRGIAPSEATDALIKLEWLRAARAKTEDERKVLRNGPKAAGVDVANSEDGDKAAIAVGEGAELQSVTSHRCPDANAFARQHVVPLIGPKLAQERVGIDSVGVGAGSVNEARRLGYQIVPLNGGNSPIFVLGDSEKYENLRAQMYWLYREDARTGNLAMPPEPDEELDGDLTAVTWGTRNGKIFVEKKENIVPLLGRSPDKGDAAVYWNWVRHHPGRPAFNAKAFTPARPHA